MRGRLVRGGWARLGRVLTELRAAREAAYGRLPTEVGEYLALGDSDDAAEQAWSRWALRPRVLRDVDSVSIATTLLGRPSLTPLLVAPTGYHRMLHPEAEVATARGARAAGATFVVSTRATARFEDIADTGVDWWLQVYVLRDRGLTRQLVHRAAACGARALVLTGDTPYLGGQAAFAGPLATRSAHLANLGVDLSTLAPDATVQDPSTTFDDIGRLRETGGLPVLVKGVLRGDDARRCLDAGASGIIVSNHGGRQLHQAVATAAALPEVVAAVGSDGEVLVDGGIRDGTSAATALALGARGVLVGRPVQWGLAADGAAGVQAVLGALGSDLARTCGLLGARSTVELTADLVATAPRG